MKVKILKYLSQKTTLAILAITLTALAANCSAAKSVADAAAGTATYLYTSTTSRGDLVTYSITGSNATVDWNVTDATGAIQFTAHLAATCGAQNATFGYRTCTIGTVSCTAGAVTCPAGTPPSGTFDIMEIPGTAVIVHISAAVAAATEGVAAKEELHAGFISGGCPADISGDYAYIRASRANGSYSAFELFGLYRTNANFSGANSITHAEFGMTYGATTALGAMVTTYVNNPLNLSGIDSPAGTTCQNGVYTRTIGTSTFRVNATAGGTFIVDMPAGEGGLISFKTTNAAVISDIANKSWWGISFPDLNAPELISLTSGAVGATVSNAVDFTGTTINNIALNAKVMPVSDASLATRFAAPAAYTANNALHLTFAAPANIPGLMQIDDGTGNKNIVAMVSKIGTQLMMYGVTFDYRNSAGATCVPTGVGDTACVARNSGNFIVFSH